MSLTRSTLIIGESMLELTQHSNNLLKQAFAGDTHSVAVYLKRLDSDKTNEVRLLSAMGTDALSHQLKTELSLEGVDTSLLLQHPTKTVGLYMVHTDNHGERSFQYWRSQSAAKEVMYLLDALPEIKASVTPNTVFFSGITLAILDQHSRYKLRDWLQQLRNGGATIVFDPNYRPALWENKYSTKQNYKWAFEISDVVLPGMDDLTRLYQVSNTDEAWGLIKTLCKGEAIIKDGDKGVTYYHNSTVIHVPITPVAHPVDTTAAGDSFNAGYLASRGQKLSVADAIAFAAQVAATVIQHKGAIIPKSALTNQLNQ